MSIADHMAKMGGPAPEMKAEGAPEAGGHYQIHPHEDGSAHTITPDGEKTEHPHMGHALAHVAGHHSPEHKHSVMEHHEDDSHTSHHHDGETSGPHDHQNLQALKDHMDKFLNEENTEYTDKQGDGNSLM